VGGNREDSRWPGGQYERVDLDGFARDGYAAVRGAVDAHTAAAARELIWATLAERGIRRDDRGSWPAHVDIGDLSGEPFASAGMAPALTAAYDELIGPGRWNQPVDLGNSVVVRFPREHDRGNAGYHIEGSYAPPDGSGGAGWVNIRSRARGLLALFLFTDVGPDDAPTRLMCGSHLYVPEFLAPHGEAGTGSDATFWRESVLCLPAAHATGRAGDVFLCHPFIVHTATWPHRGAGPRMIAQPAVNAPDGFVLDGSDPSPVARAIVTGLELAARQAAQDRAAR
jgi:Phytanoyl-CoA dioxygenase (PhyH)